MTLNEWRIKNKLSYYNLGLKLGFSGINPATTAQRICLTVKSDKRFPKPHIVEKIRSLTNLEVDYKDLYDAYLKATQK
jgi:hypothetical protein